MKALKLIDILGPECKIKIQSNDTYKTQTGGLLTLLFIVLGVLAFVAFGRDIIEKKLPRVNFNKVMDNGTILTLTHDNFAFTVINQADSKPVPEFERKFVPYLDIFDNRDGGYTQQTYNFTKCTDAAMMAMKNQLRVDAKNYYCLPEGTVINITGTFLVGNFISSRLNLDYCTKEKSGRTDCYTKEETKKTITNLQMNLIFYDYYTDSLNYTDPFVQTFYSDNILTTGDSFSRQIIYFKTLEFKTDEGWILEDVSVKRKTAVEKADTTLSPRPGTNTIFSHMFVNSKWKDIYSRDYIKIQGVFAFIGGFINISQIILRTFCSFLIYPDILKVFYDQFNDRETKNREAKKIDMSSTFNIKQHNDQNECNLNNTPFKNNNYIEVSPSPLKNQMQRSKTIKKKLDFKYEKFTHVQKFLRFFAICYKSDSMTRKMNHLVQIEKLYIRKFSMEHFTNLSRKIKIFETLVFEPFQRNLMKFIDLPEHEDKNNNYEELYAHLNKQIKENKLFINKNLMMVLDK